EYTSRSRDYGKIHWDVGARPYEYVVGAGKHHIRREAAALVLAANAQLVCLNLANTCTDSAPVEHVSRRIPYATREEGDGGGTVHRHGNLGDRAYVPQRHAF